MSEKPLTEKDMERVRTDIAKMTAGFLSCSSEEAEITEIIKGIEKEIISHPDSARLKELLVEAQLEQFRLNDKRDKRRSAQFRSGLGRING